MQFRIGDHVELADGTAGFVTEIQGGNPAQDVGGAGARFTVARQDNTQTKVPHGEIKGRLSDPAFEIGSHVKYGDALAEVTDQAGPSVRLRFASGFQSVPAHELALENGGTGAQA